MLTESVPPGERAKYEGDRPGRPVRFVRCPRRSCGAMVTVRAAAYQRANVEVVEPEGARA